MTHEWMPPGPPQDGTPAAPAPQEPAGPAAYGPPVPFGVHPHAPFGHPPAPTRRGTSPVVVGVVVAVAVVLVGMLVAGVASMAVVLGTEEVVVTEEAEDPFEGLSGEQILLEELEVGDCFLDPVGRSGDGETSLLVPGVERVDCDDPHEAEVVGLPELDELPDGSDGFHDDAWTSCDDAFYDYATAADYDDWDIWVEYYWPSKESWRLGDRTLTCAARWDEPRTGSVAREDARA